MNRMCLSIDNSLGKKQRYLSSYVKENCYLPSSIWDAGQSGLCVGTTLEKHDLCHSRSDVACVGALYPPWMANEGQARCTAEPQMACFQTLNLALWLQCTVCKRLSLISTHCSDCSEKKKPTWQILRQVHLHGKARLSMSVWWTRQDLQTGSITLLQEL